MLLASGASIPTIAGTVEEEEEYARSEANSAHYDGYVTDHTDLASEIDIDESEYRRELLNDVRQFIRVYCYYYYWTVYVYAFMRKLLEKAYKRV